MVPKVKFGHVHGNFNNPNCGGSCSNCIQGKT